MIVLDASAAADVILNVSHRAEWAADLIGRAGHDVFAPHLLDVEVVSALRRRVIAGALPARRAEAAIALLRLLPVRRYPHTEFLDAIWLLRGRLTAYDAAYVALAQALDATVITTDQRLGRAGLGDRVVTYPG